MSLSAGKTWPSCLSDGDKRQTERRLKLVAAHIIYFWALQKSKS